MSSTTGDAHADDTTESVEILYLDLLRAFYDEVDRPRSEAVAARLEVVLADSPEIAASIFGDEVRSLLAELRGDLDEAIRSREAEVGKIRELHGLSRGTPSWAYVSRQYGDRDLSDRLDLLAGLLAERGEFLRAVEVLRESEFHCRVHAIPFDGADLLEEYVAQLPPGQSPASADGPPDRAVGAAAVALGPPTAAASAAPAPRRKLP